MFGKELRRIRESYGINQSDLAETAGVTQSYIYKIEEKGSVPAPEKFEKIMLFLFTPKFNFDYFLSLIQEYEQSVPAKQRDESREKIKNILVYYFRNVFEGFEFLQEYDEFINKYFASCHERHEYDFIPNAFETFYNSINLMAKDAGLVSFKDKDMSTVLRFIDDIRPDNDFIRLYYQEFEENRDIKYESGAGLHKAALKLFLNNLSVFPQTPQQYYKESRCFVKTSDFIGFIFLDTPLSKDYVVKNTNQYSSLCNMIKFIDNQLKYSTERDLFYKTLFNQVKIFEELINYKND